MTLASALAAFFAGVLTAFTVTVGGEMPLGELILIGIFAWIVLGTAVTGSVPPEVPRTRLFRVLLLCQAVAFAAYIFSDIYRHSTVHDMSRGWARMVFLAIDIVSVAYLFGCSRLNLLMLLLGQYLGDALHAVTLGALYGDMWKFGIGTPFTFLAFFAASLLGRPAVVAAAFAMSAVHFAMDFRSMCGICFVVGTATLITLFPRHLRAWLILPTMVIIACGLGAYAYGRSHGNSHRATRSDISRTSMIIAASEAFLDSPVIGQGSWLSRSNVFENFAVIRANAAKAAHVGGFPEANEAPGTVAIHSQILVALAEGGILGGSFFIAFGIALAAAVYRLVFILRSNRFTGIYLLILLCALGNLLISPFSGAHRIYIAIACGLVIVLQREPAGLRAAQGSVPLCIRYGP
jgi:hypothetical protein